MSLEKLLIDENNKFLSYLSSFNTMYFIYLEFKRISKNKPVRINNSVQFEFFQSKINILPL